MHVVPVPAHLAPAPGITFVLAPDAAIRSDAAGVGAYAAAALGLSLVADHPAPAVALLLTDRVDGDEAYELEVAADGIVIRARTDAGLFYGVQTLLQLTPAGEPRAVAGVRIVDAPRFAYRGAMLDVARHFFGVDVVLRFIDEISRYKINVLHLHLTDDQGWRIAIGTRPELARVGGAAQVGAGAGGCFSQDEYARIVAHAAARHVTIVPEIDMPGHTNAALVSYPELTVDGAAPAVYTGVDVGFSTFAVHREATYEFVRDVVAEVAALTPGPYLHIGGDEAQSTPTEDYLTFMRRVQPIVAAAGKTVVGWHQIGAAERIAGRIVQYWGRGTELDEDTHAALAQGDRFVLSPADRVYLDMKYAEDTPIGHDWAGYITTRTAYAWDPGALLPAGADVVGIEAPLWTEFVTTAADIDLLVFPRLAAVAEVAWSPQEARDWQSFRDRLATHGPQWTARGVRFHPDPEIPWA
ncbi:beta-N-acetylhexosaminidase [Dactylosporangium matsuzakiense]|uniref:beta-N-acetylhexosaminidase n=1 Tax=Dactylosporangium matsuzakiense TaxID=53360 RepID=A0A9W6NMT0_9ACTN|nr:beta-N-acetylhexosaminidase [Dactylosporangium matsuzakiense]UWZ43139.1 family 20 glycosylhydrolase [Dactylosporangium matsuzakiense]GLL02774.1 beta-N-acetylhexosaminidase [Dactylosporangium matsuzakiense]